jgi:hypothetical protein
MSSTDVPHLNIPGREYTFSHCRGGLDEIAISSSRRLGHGLKWLPRRITQHPLLWLPEDDQLDRLDVPVWGGRLPDDVRWDGGDDLDVGFAFRCIRSGFDIALLGGLYPAGSAVIQKLS